MSQAISLHTEPPVDGVSCDFENLGSDFEAVFYDLVDSGFDIFPYVFAAQEAGRAEATGENPLDDPDLRDFERDALQGMLSNDFHDPEQLLKELDLALGLIEAMDEDHFNWGKAGFKADLLELKETLPRVIAAKARVQLVWG